MLIIGPSTRFYCNCSLHFYHMCVKTIIAGFQWNLECFTNTFHDHTCFSAFINKTIPSCFTCWIVVLLKSIFLLDAMVESHFCNGSATQERQVSQKEGNQKRFKCYQGLFSNCSKRVTRKQTVGRMQRMTAKTQRLEMGQEQK